VIPASEVVVGDEIPFRPVNTDEVADAYPYEKTVTVTKLGQEPFCGKVYDPINAEGHLFYTADGLLTSNCAYQFGASPESDPEFFDKLYFRNGAHFSMGAGQVVTLNCPRAAYESGKDVKKLVARLKGLMDIAAEIFTIKQRWMREIVTHDRIPFAMQRPRDPITGELGAVAVDLPGLVYTVGIVGINEMVQYLTGSQLYESKEAVKAAVYVLVELNKYARELTERHGFTIAMARTPAETTGQRFAVADLLSDRYHADAITVVKGDLETFERDVGTTRDLPVYYNNGTHIPVDAPISIYDKIRVEEIFFTLVQGGNIFHAFLGETMPDPHGLAEFGLNIAKNTQIGYFAFTRDLTIPLRRYRRYAVPA
jgi:ribonucleoside-triphosphate reductase